MDTAAKGVAFTSKNPTPVTIHQHRAKTTNEKTTEM